MDLARNKGGGKKDAKYSRTYQSLRIEFGRHTLQDLVPAPPCRLEIARQRKRDAEDAPPTRDATTTG